VNVSCRERQGAWKDWLGAWKKFFLKTKKGRGGGKTELDRKTAAFHRMPVLALVSLATFGTYRTGGFSRRISYSAAESSGTAYSLGG